MGKVISDDARPVRFVGMAKNAGYGYIEWTGNEFVRIPIKGFWDAPCLATVPIPSDSLAAYAIMTAWLAYPQWPSQKRDSHREKAARATLAKIIHDAYRTGQFDTIPRWANAKTWPKDKRESNAATAKKLAADRMDQAFRFLFPLIMMSVANSEKVRWSGSRSLNSVIERIYPDNGWRTFKAGFPVLTLAYAIDQHGWPTDRKSLRVFLERAEMHRQSIGIIKKPAIRIEETIQFRPA